jgi:hypothetical protein
MNRSPGSVSKGGLRIPGLLPTPRTTQTSPSPKNKRQSSDEYDLDHAAKKQKRDSGYFSVLSSQLSSPPEDLEEKETECKTCFQEVDRALVEKYPWPSSCPTMHDKRIFCNWHKTEEAKQEWKCKGYPTINWVELKKKLDDYNSQLQQVIDEPETSHYRKELKDKTKTGKGQSLARMEQNGLEGVDLELGFYGYRGLTMM